MAKDPHEICKWHLETIKHLEEQERVWRQKLNQISDLVVIAKGEEFGPKEADNLLDQIQNLLGFGEAELRLPKLHKEVEWRPPDDYTLDQDTW